MRSPRHARRLSKKQCSGCHADFRPRPVRSVDPQPMAVSPKTALFSHEANVHMGTFDRFAYRSRMTTFLCADAHWLAPLSKRTTDRLNAVGMCLIAVGPLFFPNAQRKTFWPSLWGDSHHHSNRVWRLGQPCPLSRLPPTSMRDSDNMCKVD